MSAKDKDEGLGNGAEPLAADIPDLKKREKERKKAGTGWWFGRSAKSPFSGATGGRGIAGAARGAASAGRTGLGAASALGRSAAGGGLGSWLAGLTSSLLGRILLSAGVACLLAGGGLYAYSRYLARQAASLSPDLGPLSSSMRVRSGSGDRFGFSPGDRGLLKFDKAQASAAPAPKEPVEEAPPAEPAVEGELADGGKGIDSILNGALRDKMEHNLQGARLSTDLGGSFGNKNIFASMTGLAPKFGDNVDRTRLQSFRNPASKTGKMTASRAMAGPKRASDLKASRVRSGRAIAQAKFAKGMSAQGAAANTLEGSRYDAVSAFEQNAGAGGVISGADMPNSGVSVGEGPVTPVGGLTPDLPEAPETPTGMNVTPYQGPLDMALNLGAIAGMLKKMSMMLMALGAILIAIGAALMFNPMTAMIGAALMGAGIALLLMGLMMLMMANQMASMARGMGDQIGSQYGQEYQEQIVDECMDQAVNNGTPPAGCDPATKPEPAKTTIEEDVRKEREATFELETGQPLNGNNGIRAQSEGDGGNGKSTAPGQNR